MEVPNGLFRLRAPRRDRMHEALHAMHKDTSGPLCGIDRL